MPGCLSYVVSKDREDESGIWITEVWDSETSHTASLTLPIVKEAITKGRSLIARFGPRYVTNVRARRTDASICRDESHQSAERSRVKRVAAAHQRGTPLSIVARQCAVAAL
jgi:hypothetical protein